MKISILQQILKSMFFYEHIKLGISAIRSRDIADNRLAPYSVLDDYNYGSISVRWNNVLSLINAIDFSFNGFMSLNFIKYKGILDQNDISFQLKLIYELGAQERLFGVTHECSFPNDATQKPRVIEIK